MNEESFLEFESGIWKAVPKNPALGPLISGTDVTDSTFEFALKCSLCDDRTETFRLRFSPGAPSRMNVLQEHIGHVIDSNALYSISLSRDFPAETFTLVLFDAYGNRTGPDRSERWTVSADTGGPLEHFNPIVCNPDGTITVQDLRPKASALGFMVQTLKLNSSKNNKRFKSLTWDFGVTVSMSRKPSALKVRLGIEMILLDGVGSDQ